MQELYPNTSRRAWSARAYRAPQRQGFRHVQSRGAASTWDTSGQACVLASPATPKAFLGAQLAPGARTQQHRGSGSWMLAT